MRTGPVPLVSILLLLAGGRLSGVAQQEYAYLLYPVEKLRTTESPAASTRAVVHLAGNEHESVIIGLYNPGREATSITSVQVTRPSGPGCELSLYRVAYVPVRTSSRWFALLPGQWPDPIVPLEAESVADSSAGTAIARWAPENGVVVPPRENRSLLLELYLPPGLTASESLTIAVVLSNGRKLTLSVEVSPWRFDLPRKGGLVTSFLLPSTAVLSKHAELSASAGRSDPLPGDLMRDYQHQLARFGVTPDPIYEGTPAAKTADGSLTFDWTGFDSSIGAALDGTLFPEAPPATSFQVPVAPPDLTSEQLDLFYREVVRHVREEGWLSRMYFYVTDEPERAEYPRVRELAARIKQADQSIRTMVTEPWVRELSDVIDIWCVDVPVLGDSVPVLPLAARGPWNVVFDWQVNPPPSQYVSLRAQGKEAWLYTCDSAIFLDYPDLFIDADAAAARVLPWLAYRHGFTGLLYWNTVSSYPKPGDPWDDQYQYLANGDGNLLYPGIPGRPDIRAHSPIPSLRLQRLRDGLEDYKYLMLLEEALGPERARAVASEVAGSSLRWLHRQAEVERVREAIGDLLAKAPTPSS